MNSLQCAKISTLCITVLGTFLIFCVYSSNFVQNGIKWNLSLEPVNLVLANKPKEVINGQKGQKSQSEKPSKDQKSGPSSNISKVIPLAPNVKLKLLDFKDETWSSEAWNLLESEVHWSKITDFEFKLHYSKIF